jgi:hypothetical protein
LEEGFARCRDRSKLVKPRSIKTRLASAKELELSSRIDFDRSQRSVSVKTVAAIPATPESACVIGANYDCVEAGVR